MRRSLLLLLLVLAPAACAGVPMASPQEDDAAKQFGAPPPHTSALYVYRSGWFALARSIDVTAASGTHAKLGVDTYLRLETAPGQADVACKTSDAADSLRIALASGETRYVEVVMLPGLWGPGCKVTEVPAEQGRSAVRSGRRAAPL